MYSIGVYWKLFFRAHFWVHVHCRYSCSREDNRLSISLDAAGLCHLARGKLPRKKENLFLQNLLRNYSYHWKAWEKWNTHVFPGVEECVPTRQGWNSLRLSTDLSGMPKSTCFLHLLVLPVCSGFPRLRAVMTSHCDNMVQECELTFQFQGKSEVLGKRSLEQWHSQCVTWEVLWSPVLPLVPYGHCLMIWQCKGIQKLVGRRINFITLHTYFLSPEEQHHINNTFNIQTSGIRRTVSLQWLLDLLWKIWQRHRWYWATQTK